MVRAIRLAVSVAAVLWTQHAFALSGAHAGSSSETQKSALPIGKVSIDKATGSVSCSSAKACCDWLQEQIDQIDSQLRQPNHIARIEDLKSSRNHYISERYRLQCGRR